MKKSVTRDRFSELPDSLIHVILSLLPMRDVISTTLLSKRWNNLWTTTPFLNFCEAGIEDDAKQRIRNFVNRALIFWKGQKIVKFRIHLYEDFDMSLAVDVDLCVRFAVVNNVEDLNINLEYGPETLDWRDPVEDSKNNIYTVPQCLNSCSSIKHLSLLGCNLRIPGSPSWNQLKSLKINGFCLGEHLINRIMWGCPKLEVFELRLMECNENLNIKSTSLKILKIEKYLYYDDDVEPSLDTELRICCANLETLEITGALYCKCLVTNVSSLTDVTLGFYGRDYSGTSWNEPPGETLRQIYSIIHHVEKVTLSSWCVEVLGALQKKYLPSLSLNVKLLKLTSVHITKLGDKKGLFGIFPNLKILVFEDLRPHQCDWIRTRQLNANNYLGFETSFSKSFLLQLKTIVITSYDLLDSSTLLLMEFLLKHAGMLEKFVILDKGRISFRLLKVAKKLLSMPRSSPTAKVIFSDEREPWQKEHCSACKT